MSIILPDLIAQMNTAFICDRSEISMLIEEHAAVLNEIEKENAEGAVKALRNHFRYLYQYIKE